MPQYSPDCRTTIHQHFLLTQKPRHKIPPRNTENNSPRLTRGHGVPALLARGWQVLRRTLAYALAVTAIGLSGITVAVAQVPGTPTNLSVEIDETGDNEVVLDWDAPSGTVTGYKIEVSTDYDGILTGTQTTSEWGVVESNTGGTSTSYTHGNIGVLPSLQLCYRVSAINANGTGASSSAVCDTALATQNEPELVAPDPLTATYPIIVKGDTIEITFDENLNVNVIPAEVQFNVAVHGFRSQPRVDDVEIMGAKVILTLDVADAIRNIDTVTIRYRPPTHRFDGDGNQIVFIPSASNSLQDSSGKLVNLIRGQRARNITPGPVTVTLALDMNAIDEDGGSTMLRATVWPLPAEDFTVTLSTDPASTAGILTQELDGQTLSFTTGHDSSTNAIPITAVNNDENMPAQKVKIMGTSETHVTVKPVTLSITDDELGVAFGQDAYTVIEGRSVSVTVELDQDPEATVMIPLTVDPPCASDDECSYSGVPESLTFNSGETVKTITFETVVDEDKEDDMVTLEIDEDNLAPDIHVGSPSTTTVTIREVINDVNKELLPRIAQAMIASTLSAISSRVEMEDAGSDGAASLDGNSALEQVLALVPSAAEPNSLDLKRALTGKSFVLPLDGVEGGLDGLTLWGRGDYRDMEGGDDRPIEWDGDLLSVHVGADMHLHQDILAGLVVSWSEGDFDYRDRTGFQEGRYESEMTSVHPYVSWVSSERDLRTWVTVGYGRGEVDVKDDRSKHSSDTRLKTGAMGVSGHLYTTDELFGYSGIATVRFKADGHMSEVKTDGGGDINPLTSDIQRVRAALEGSHECPLGGGRMLLPTVEVGLRHDSGDGLEGTGFEIGAGVRYTDPSRGLTVEGRGRYLVAHSDDYDEWGFQGSVRVDPGSDRRGLALSLVPGWGAYQSGLNQLWSRDAENMLSLNQNRSTKGHLEVEIDYGLPAAGGHGLLTPYMRFSLGGGGDNYRLGSRFELGTELSLYVESGRLRDVQGESNHGIRLQAELQF